MLDSLIEVHPESACCKISGASCIRGCAGFRQALPIVRLERDKLTTCLPHCAIAPGILDQEPSLILGFL
jgi:hypothetical protein